MESLAAPLQESIAGKRSPLSISAPSPVYLSGEEQLRFTSISNASGLTVTVSGRILGPDGVVRPFDFPHSPNSNRTTATTTVALSEGWLLSVEAKITSGTSTFGSVWALVEFVRGQGSAARVVSSLQSDLISPVSPLEWPGAAAVNPLDGAGCLRAIVGTTPGVGAEVSETVPTGARWQLIAFSTPLVTSATVANRVPALVLDDGTNLMWAGLVQGNETAGLVWSNYWAPGMPSLFTAATNYSVFPLPFNPTLPAGGRVRTITAGLQVGDQYAAPKYLVREWFDV